ncbi:asparagine synthase-related protein [Actinophytocola oryzae]|uniref:Asparagine synthase (Glutamine-hydrolysing) n=1 Tax=Actinophytocola oryzae TaxID=502181 RepID=A0A4R7VD41_9PSEU|nr:asparagine synthase-related protein [Actinophytocola oryzae]TDV46898.1 asparagine synthase (glutamine-hydrolysing) [Actinophytocola oryzae]
MGLYTPDPLEIAGGWVNGFDPVPLPPGPHDSPRVVLDRMLPAHLRRSPCLVAFSGGRDSSVLLSAAVAVARRERLPLPVPITLSYPDAPDADESRWQTAVLDHLGIRDRIVLTVHDEHDPLGPVATPVLRRHGLVWPPNFAPTIRMMTMARGGTLLTGEGGDESFGLKRVTPLKNLLSRRGLASPGVYGDVLGALRPAFMRRHAALRGRYRRPWLRPDVEHELARRDAADLAAFALSAARNTWQFATRRTARIAYETMRVLGDEMDVTYVQAFAEPALVASVAAQGGFLGWTGRTATMRDLFGDLLPREVLERRTKALFANAIFTRYTREFARTWHGSGVDGDLVDAGALRETWLSQDPHAPSMSLLQQAWLAAHRMH